MNAAELVLIPAPQYDPVDPTTGRPIAGAKLIGWTIESIDCGKRTPIALVHLNGDRTASRKLADALCALPNLVDALQATTAAVELDTRNGVRQQPPDRFVDVEGQYDIEAIAQAGRVALSMVTL